MTDETAAEIVFDVAASLQHREVKCSEHTSARWKLFFSILSESISRAFLSFTLSIFAMTASAVVYSADLCGATMGGIDHGKLLLYVKPKKESRFFMKYANMCKS